MTNEIIHVSNLTKRYGRTSALDGLDLSVSAGEVHGFLGPNGAGKSTTIRVLLGLARATSGAATVFGLDPWNDAPEAHRRIAYVPGDVNLWPGLTGGETIDLLARLRGVSHNDQSYRRRREALTEAFQFDPSKRGRAYSKGNRQKVALIAAFAVPAELYILDEPTSGLDPLMEAEFGRQVQGLRDRGATVLLSSHILSEVETLCDRVSIIRAGKRVDTGTLAELRHLTRTEIGFSDEGIDSDGKRRLRANADIHDIIEEHGRLRLTVDSHRVDSVLPLLADLRVRDLTIAPPSLEELFLRHYREEADAQEAHHA